MNLFVLGWNLPAPMFTVAHTELRKMIEVYPQLDLNTIWAYGKGGTAFAVSMHTASRAAAPRCYVSQTNDQVTFYDGCLVDRTGVFAAYNAVELSLHWERLPEALEGQFVVARVTKSPPSIEMLTDPIGMEQVYYLHLQNMWLISNSVALIARIGKTSALDPLGASLFLSMGFVGGDRTLRRDIRTIPGGQHWKFQQNNVEPIRKAYFTVSGLARQRQKVPALPDVGKLAEELTKICQTLAETYGELHCPITGGRDSRLLVSLLIHSGIRAEYYTGGIQSNVDVIIGTQIAEIFKLPHKVIATTSDLIEEWDTASWNLIRQHDGMVSLWQVADLLGQPSHIDRLGMNLWGVGGEMARGLYSAPENFLFNCSKERMQRYFIKRFVSNRAGLVRHEATALAEAFLLHLVEKAIDQGFSPIDAPDVFYTYQRLRRWGGSNARKGLSIYDNYPLFCTRPFIESAFNMSALRRCSEPLHYGIIRLLAPQLHSLPFDRGSYATKASGNWRSQKPHINIARLLGEQLANRVSQGIRRRLMWQLRSSNSTRTPTSAQALWLETNCLKLRDICLSQQDSTLWKLLNRPLFERITAPTTSPAERNRYMEGLIDVATLFYYQST